MRSKTGGSGPVGTTSAYTATAYTATAYNGIANGVEWDVAYVDVPDELWAGGPAVGKRESFRRQREPRPRPPRHRIQVNGYLSWRISSRNLGSQPARFRRVLTLPLRLLARTRPRAKRRTMAMFLAPCPVR